MRSSPITADLLAGGGGSSCGAEQAGAQVVLAVNHSPLAIEIHQRNHPWAHHVVQDVGLVDYSPWWRRLDLLLASPACQGHSKAATNCSSGRRGTAPKHDADRATALAVVSALEQTRAPVAVIENVPDMRKWVLFDPWCEMLRRLGYRLREHVIDAADLGCPAHRSRMFIVATRSRAPFDLHLPTVDRVGIGSVFDAKADGWKPAASLPASARARFARAIARFPAAHLIPVQYTTTNTGTALDDQLGTITTQHQAAWLRRGPLGLERRMFTPREYLRCLGFPESYHLTGRITHDVHLIGNAVAPPVMRAIVEDLVRRA